MESIKSRNPDGNQNREYYARYYREHKDRIARLNKERYNKVRSTPEGLLKHRKRCLESTHRYRIKHKDKVVESRKKLYLLRKRRAMDKIGGAKCVNCGCEIIEFLEINHKNGGGAKEWRENKQALVDRILSGTRDTNDLDVLCRVCNALDHLKRLKPEYAINYEIKYNINYANRST